MTQEEKRKEALDLLARGKITIDEAVTLLDRSADEQVVTKKDETGSPDDISLKVDVSVIEEESATDLVIEDIPLPKEKPAGAKPRWLHIHVAELDTGNSKVKVNIPFGMVKFGVGMARMFAPEEYSENLEAITEMVSASESGLLVDVQDVEDNEHVRIYFD